MPMPIILPTSPTLLRVQLDQRIDPHDSHARLDRALQLLDFAHARLQHARLHAIVHPAFRQIKAVVLVILMFRLRFRVGGIVAQGVLLGRGATLGCGGVGCRGWGVPVGGLGLLLGLLVWLLLLLRRAVVGGRCGRGCALGEGVAGAELGDELGAVFCCVHGEGGGDGEEGGGEGADG